MKNAFQSLRREEKTSSKSKSKPSFLSPSWFRSLFLYLCPFSTSHTLFSFLCSVSAADMERQTCPFSKINKDNKLVFVWVCHSRDSYLGFFLIPMCIYIYSSQQILFIFYLFILNGVWTNYHFFYSCYIHTFGNISFTCKYAMSIITFYA